MAEPVGALTLALNPDCAGLLQRVTLVAFLARDGEQAIRLGERDIRRGKGG